MFGALTSLTGGGGMSASSSASASQETSNQISSGTISVGGLNMAPRQSFMNSDAVKLALVGGLVLGAVWMMRK